MVYPSMRGGTLYLLFLFPPAYAPGDAAQERQSGDKFEAAPIGGGLVGDHDRTGVARRDVQGDAGVLAGAEGVFLAGSFVHGMVVAVVENRHRDVGGLAVIFHFQIGLAAPLLVGEQVQVVAARLGLCPDGLVGAASQNPVLPLKSPIVLSASPLNQTRNHSHHFQDIPAP